MPLHTVDRIISLLGKDLKKKHLLICGVSYRQDVGDTRFSPSESLVRELVSREVKVTCHDPYLSYWDEMNIELDKKLPCPKNFDAVIMAVPHKQYKGLDLASWASKKTLILDANSVFSNEQRKSARACGIRIESIGRANGL